ncbi:putative TonB-dependent receptor [Caenibius tardaugens NBRC 16725]|uniref:Putative TonB-dependent receptor n=1 Tax=Caenibius tardaugens NBRC 16725 TaxID=1219035 RepID=U2Y462_9SPHN|nr:TonB-dependent receptor [Caenibius tardaugens]GAD47811.1 putative TonB-dependent receptor [Caenibius tardaugens NBRC 16725]
MTRTSDIALIGARRALFCSVAGLVLAASPALAQGSDQGAAATDDIIVTAQKREQNIQDVPISMAVMGGQKLAEMGIKDFAELDRFVPNFYVQPSPGNNSYYIRGIGSTPGNLAFEQTVGLFVDGIYGGHARQFQAPFLDVERVEVLRGPQGALVGKNTSAGAISIVSARPTKDLQATLEGGYEFELGGGNLFGMVSGPISDVVSARVAAQWEKSDGYVRNKGLDTMDGGRESLFARGSVLIDPDKGWDLLLRVEGGKVDLDGTPAEQLFTAKDPDLVRDTTGFPNFVGQDWDNTKTLNASATANIDIGDHTLTSITGYSSYKMHKRIDSDFQHRVMTGSEFREDFHQYSQELRLASPTTRPLEYIVGIYGHINDYDLTQATQIAALIARYFKQDNKVWSAYGSATYKFSDRLRLTGSIRYTYDRKTADQNVYSGPNLIRTLTGKRVEKEWDPSLNLQWNANDDVMFYVSWGQGSKAGGFIGGQTATTQAQFEVDPERSETWEAGAKFTLLDRKLRLNLAAYRTTFSDLQVSAYDAVASEASGTNVWVTKNAGKARSQGVEGDFSFRVVDGLTLNGSVAYLDAKYVDFVGAPCFWNEPKCAVDTNDAAGMRLPRSPKWSGTIGFDFTTPINDRLEFAANGTMAFRSKTYLEESYNPIAAQSANQKIDARLAVRTSDKRWEIALVGKNLTNKITSSYAFGTPGLVPSDPGGISKFVLQPRTIAIQARFNY